MKRSERDEWTAALRSGEFMQGRGTLAYCQPSDEWKRCCLGVKCELDVRAGRHGIERHVSDTNGTSEAWFGIAGRRRNDAMPTEEILEAWGLTTFDADKLAAMNDAMYAAGRTFVEIADWIEENVPVEEDSTVDATAS